MPKLYTVKQYISLIINSFAYKHKSSDDHCTSIVYNSVLKKIRLKILQADGIIVLKVTSMLYDNSKNNTT